MESDVPIAADRSAIPRTVAQLWCEVLNVPEVSDTDDFFELGGHSLAALHVVAAMEDSFHVDLGGVEEMWDHPTLAEFTSFVARRIDEGTPAPAAGGGAVGAAEFTDHTPGGAHPPGDR